MVLLMAAAGCSGPPTGWAECGGGFGCDMDYTCIYTHHVDATTCVTDPVKHCVKRCTTDADCMGESSAKGLTETCTTDCAADRVCDGVR